jgi:hypothetical protein
MVVLISWYRSRQRGERVVGVELERSHSIALSFLAVATLYSMTLPLRETIHLLDAAILIGIFIAYTIRIATAPAEEPHLVGPARYIGTFTPARRRGAVAALFLFAATVILLLAERFAASLVATGLTLGVSEFLLVQWLAPLASEAPEGASPSAEETKRYLTIIARESERLEIPAGQSDVKRFVSCHMPPASTKPSGDPECRAADSATLQLAIHRSASLPLLEHEHSQSAVKPLIHVRENPGCVSQTEIRLPSQQIASQQRHDLREAASAAPRGEFSNALPHRFEGRRCYATLTIFPGAIQKLYPRNDRCHAGATALFAGLTRSLSFAYS